VGQLFYPDLIDVLRQQGMTAVLAQTGGDGVDGWPGGVRGGAGRQVAEDYVQDMQALIGDPARTYDEVGVVGFSLHGSIVPVALTPEFLASLPATTKLIGVMALSNTFLPNWIRQRGYEDYEMDLRPEVIASLGQVDPYPAIARLH